MNIAAIFFVFAALGGILMLVMRLLGHGRPPTWLAVGHGAIAGTGLATLGFACSQSMLPVSAIWSLGLLILAALGGATLFIGFHLRGRPFPLLFAIGHGLTAVAGLGFLLNAIFG
ncbi:hypothetical protein [Anatilimnocola floriformis]|uniref:hypothetical protein n=1 Tax=Anatilimnocola floriformis TaxID=2948575 RepID=UPI0020C34D41|nr:hypothetical protein [Anatilimnocola floriformis]